MNNRRQFFGQLGLIIGAAAAPTILIPKTKIYWGRALEPEIHKLRVTWCPELEQDLMAYHGIDAREELEAVYMDEIYKEVAQRFPDKRFMGAYRGQRVLVEPLWGTTRYETFVKVV